MIAGMPISTFFAICIWPFVYIIAAFIDYFVMKHQDDQVDDSEFEAHLGTDHRDGQVHEHHHHEGEGGSN